MTWKVFIGTTLSALVAAWTLPASAQGQPRTDGTGAQKDDVPSEPPPASPSSGRTADDTAPKDAPLPPPPAVDRRGSLPGNASAGLGSSDEEMADTGPTKIGAVPSPLIMSAGLGYAYAAVTHPDLVSHSLSGAFLEVSAGTELDRRFRLSVAFTSFETRIRRTRKGQWEEGAYADKTASGLHALADPVEPVVLADGGIEVQKTFHAHSVGPRMDFLPLGSQGPYLGMTAAVAIIQDVATRVGGDLAARVGGEWRPFQALGLAIEAGAHGQIYTDSKAAIPYALARMTLMLDPTNTHRDGRGVVPSSLVMPRTLPPAMPR